MPQFSLLKLQSVRVRLGAFASKAWLAATALALLPALGAQAQVTYVRGQSFFRADAEAAQAAVSSPLAAALHHSRALTLDVAGLRAQLAAAPLQGSGGRPVVLALPLPDGSSARFAVAEAPVMAPDLAAQFPTIKTYAGTSLEEAGTTVRFDLSPAGFHAQVLSPTRGTMYIDPVTRTDARHYLSFFRADMNRAAAGGAGMACGFAPSAADEATADRRLAAYTGPNAARLNSGAQLRTYRLALATTKEYTNFHGGTVAGAQAAMVTSVNRVVGVLEKEMAVRLVLVANNTQLISTNASAFVYSNSNPSALLTENQAQLDVLIGSAGYDIGHVFSTGGGGLAGLGVVCNPGRKAQGETGSSSPVGDSFDIDFVIHEMGHQFGGRHTFNSNNGGSCGGNRDALRAYEPGSGTTIMAYAGICGPTNDVQQHSDAYFHTGSFQEMQAFISSTSCAQTSATGNTEPVVSGPASKTIPANTPFRLTATGSDADGDALTYNWEQLDLGPDGTLAGPQVAGQTIPLFRSLTATASPTRYFPRLSSLAAGTPSVGERLPTVDRTMRFRVTARDQHQGTQGVIGGVTYSSDVTLGVAVTPAIFTVTAPNTAVTWTTGTNQTVTWNVAGTDQTPISCATVNIRLSTDGGVTFPVLVASGQPNSGTATVAVPSVNTAQARIMVEAADNYFFDISDVNFTVSGPIVPTITGLSPTSGPAGSTMTLTGTSFTPGTVVTINGVVVPAANITVVSGTVIRVVLPAGATSGLVTVTTSMGTSNGVSFAVTIPAAPTITLLTPTSGYATDAVTIQGTDFTGATAVLFNTTAAVFTIVDNNTITTTVPAGATTGNVTVTTPLGTSNGRAFTVLVLAPPTLTSLSRTGAIVGSTITLTGMDFRNVTGVSFNGTPAMFTYVNNTTVTVTVPAGATSGNVTLTTPLGTTNGLNFNVLVLPNIISLTPPTGGAGSAVTINGTNFTAATDVTFNGTPIPYTVVNATTITIMVPVAAPLGQADIFVSTLAGTSNRVFYTVIVPVPTITTLSPVIGPVGTAVTITGTGFVGVTSVVFNGTPATYTVVNATSITTTVPAGAFTGDVVVASTTGTSNAVLFTVGTPPPTPVLTSLAPNQGLVGTLVNITGTGLNRASAVRLNGVSSPFLQTSTTTIQFTIPAGATTGDITVTTPGGTSNGLLFTVLTGTATRAAMAASVFTVAPVPAAAGAALHLTLAAPARTATATLHNVLGQAVATRTFAGEATTLPTTGLAAGTYLLRVAVAGQAPVTQRVVLN